MLISCWLSPMLKKSDAATLEVNMTNYSQVSRKNCLNDNLTVPLHKKHCCARNGKKITDILFIDKHFTWP